MSDLQILGATFVVASLVMALLWIVDERQRGYTLSEWLAAMRKHDIGTRYSD